MDMYFKKILDDINDQNAPAGYIQLVGNRYEAQFFLSENSASIFSKALGEIMTGRVNTIVQVDMFVWAIKVDKINYAGKEK